MVVASLSAPRLEHQLLVTIPLVFLNMLLQILIKVSSLLHSIIVLGPSDLWQALKLKRMET